MVLTDETHLIAPERLVDLDEHHGLVVSDQTLHRAVNSLTLVFHADPLVLGLNAGEASQPSSQAADMSVCFCKPLRTLVPPRQSPVETKVCGACVLCFLHCRRPPIVGSRLLNELVFVHAVDEAEVDCLGSRATLVPFWFHLDAFFRSCLHHDG